MPWHESGLTISPPSVIDDRYRPELAAYSMFALRCVTIVS